MTGEAEQRQLRNTGRGGLALSLAKGYFIVLGLVQQVVLSWLLRDAYGALRGALSPASMTYNAAVGASVFGMSRAVSQAPESEVRAVIRRGLTVHGALGVLLGVGFFLAAPLLGKWLHSDYLVPYFRWLSVVIAAYTLYAAFVGVLNGQRRFVAQASLDALAATLRTVAMVGGGYLATRSQSTSAVSGAFIGFALMSLAITLVAGVVVGIGSAGVTSHTFRRQLHFVLPVMGGQFLLNLLLQADTNTLRSAATRAAERAELPVTSADLLVGAYNAGQLFAFLPYQLLTALTFLLFPLLAAAQAAGDAAKLRRIVENGCRVALLVTGLLVSVTAALPEALLRLVFPPQFAEVGAASMRILALGMGSLAVFGVLGAVLNGLGRQWLGLLLTAGGVVGVLTVNWLFLRDVVFSPELLRRAALATSIAVVVTSVAASFAVSRLTGGGVSLFSTARVAIAISACVYLGSWVTAPGRVLTVVCAVVLGAVYLAILLLLRELTASDWRALRPLLLRRGN